MSLRSRKLKTAGKWSRVNNTVRENPDLKETLNKDSVIQSSMSEMLRLVDLITAHFGLQSTDQGDANEAKQNAFPIQKMFWLGELALDTYVAAGGGDRKVPEHAKDFAEQAATLRARTNTLLAAWRLDQDAYNKDSKGNPGGQV